MSYYHLGEGLLALAITAVLTRLSQRPAQKLGLVDHPGTRKRHKGAIPLSGGLAMYAAFALCMLVLGLVSVPFQSLILLGFLLLITGILDDLYEISVLLRFGLQIVAVVLMFWLGNICLRSLGNLTGSGEIRLGISALPFTIFAVVGIINAMNMSDGLDGLGGGLAVVVLAYFGIAASAAGMAGDLHTLILLVGCVLGFLIFNLRTPFSPKASVFMGDSGSTFLGFALAWFAIKLSQGQTPALSPMAAVWVLGLPILDTVYILLSRSLRGDSPFKSGRDHLHYLLVDSGMSVEKTVLVLVGIAAVLGGVGTLGDRLHWGESSLFYLFLLQAGGYSVFRFYLERVAARRKPAKLSA